jgi:hypothetical protein
MLTRKQWNDKDAIRFWKKVQPFRTNEECWIWMAGVCSFGYGRFSHRYFTSAHRYSYYLHKDRNLVNTPEKHVLHTCDNSLCVNPNHLYLGDNFDNSRDRETRRRCKKTYKLTIEQVIEIKKFYTEGKYNQKQLSDMYGVSDSYIARLVAGRTHKHHNV